MKNKIELIYLITLLCSTTSWEESIGASSPGVSKIALENKNKYIFF